MTSERTGLPRPSDLRGIADPEWAESFAAPADPAPAAGGPEPATHAGRRMLDNHLYWGEWYQHNWLAAIRAIEQEAAAPPPSAAREGEALRLLRETQDAMHADLVAIMAALGIEDYARPYSHHEVVVREILPAIQRLAASGEDR